MAFFKFCMSKPPPACHARNLAESRKYRILQVGVGCDTHAGTWLHLHADINGSRTDVSVSMAKKTTKTVKKTKSVGGRPRLTDDEAARRGTNRSREKSEAKKAAKTKYCNPNDALALIRKRFGPLCEKTYGPDANM